MSEHETGDQSEQQDKKKKRQRRSRSAIRPSLTEPEELPSFATETRSRDAVYRRRLQELRRQLRETLQAVGNNQTHPDVLSLSDMIDQLNDEYAYGGKAAVVGGISVQTGETYRQLNVLGAQILHSMELMQSTRRHVTVDSQEEIPIPSQGELQLSGGHLAPIVALLRNTNEAGLLARTVLYKVNASPGQNEATYTAFMPIDDMVDVLHRHSDDVMRREVGHMLQQELTNFDTKTQMMLYDMSEKMLAKAQSTQNEDSISEALREGEIAKNRIVRARMLGENIRLFITMSKAKGIDFDAVLPPVQIGGINKTLPYSEAITALCDRNMFEGEFADPVMRERLDTISAQMLPPADLE